MFRSLFHFWFDWTANDFMGAPFQVPLNKVYVRCIILIAPRFGTISLEMQCVPPWQTIWVAKQVSSCIWSALPSNKRMFVRSKENMKEPNTTEGQQLELVKKRTKHLATMHGRPQ